MAPVRGSSQQLVHAIGSGIDSEEVLGPRGAGLERAQALGLRTPSGFTLATRSREQADRLGGFSPALQSQLAEGVSRLEHELEERLDNASRPLFLSVSTDRPPMSRGRMLIGLGEHTLPALEALVGSATAASIWVSTLQRYALEVRGVDPAAVEAAVAETAGGAGAARRLLALIERSSGTPFPEAAADQLREAILACWQRMGRPGAVTVHRSVLPVDQRDPLDVGVVFTRHPATGATEIFGGFPASTPFGGAEADSTLDRQLARSAPHAREELGAALPLVELAYKRICTVAFAVEAGRLTVVDVRPARGSTLATARLLVDLVEGHVISVEEAIAAAPPSAVASPGPTMLAATPKQVLGGGAGLAPGAALAPVAVGAGGIAPLRARGMRPILVVDDAADADPAALGDCAGLLIACAASAADPLVEAARELGIPAIAGVRRLGVSELLSLLAFPGVSVREGETLAIDGGSGMVAAAEATEISPRRGFEGPEILNWCREGPRVPILPEPPPGWSVVRRAEEFGADGFERPLLIDLRYSSQERHRELMRMVATVPEQLELGLRPPPRLADTLRLPTARWSLVVGPSSPATELLAAKLAILAGGPDF